MMIEDNTGSSVQDFYSKPSDKDLFHAETYTTKQLLEIIAHELIQMRYHLRDLWEQRNNK